MQQILLLLVFIPLLFSCTKQNNMKNNNDLYEGEPLHREETISRANVLNYQENLNQYERRRNLQTTGLYIKELKLRTLRNNLPDYYGGTYTNKDGLLVVLVIGDTVKYRSDLIKILGSDSFIIETCKYSYNTLMQTVDSLSEFIQKNENRQILNELNIDYFGIKEDANKILIIMDDCSEDKIKLFKKQVLDYPFFIFDKPSDHILFD